MADSARDEVDSIRPLLPSAPVDRLTAPLQKFLAVQSSSGLILIASTVLALAWANSPWAEHYHSLWQTRFGITLGPWALEKDLLHVINDGLMTIFFFVVGLEIKREVVEGELRDPKQAALPILAAAGGMLVPALVFMAAGWLGGLEEQARRGWAIPMATDIAFVVGVLTIFGNRVPASLKILLLTLAIVDDLGAVLVIAFVFTETIHWLALLVAAVGLVATWLMRSLGIRSVPLYIAMGAAVWLAILKAGVHPTIAGVMLGLMTPSQAWIEKGRLSEIMEKTASRLQDRDEDAAPKRLLSQAEFAVREGVSPLERLEMRLHPWVAFGIMPLFALANAGVELRLDAAMHPLAMAITAGLVIGKPVGILLFSAAAIQLGIARRPQSLSWGLMTGGAALAGIGFTMSIFLASLALPAELLDAGKLGTLTGSLISVTLGSAMLLMTSRSRGADAD